jgi:hypothetical protein
MGIALTGILTSPIADAAGPCWSASYGFMTRARGPLVVRKPSRILHCGHVRIVDVTLYKGVAVINSGTWQFQTEFQKKMNIQPTPAAVTIVDIATMKVSEAPFRSEGFINKFSIKSKRVIIE